MNKEEYRSLGFPNFRSAILNVTNTCNCACVYCFTHPNPSFMSFDTAKQAIDWTYRVWLKQVGLGKRELSSTDLPSIAFFGGEPMIGWTNVVAPCLEYVRHIIDPKIKKIMPDGLMRMSITTNGTLLTDDRIRLLAAYDCPPLLSIDGDKTTQDMNRPLVNGGSSFDLVEKNLEMLLRYFPGTTFRSTVTPASVEYLFDNFCFAISKGFKNYFVTPNKYEEWSEDKIQLLESEMYKIGMMILYQIMEGNSVSYSLLDLVLKCQFLDTVPSTTIFKCGLGTNSISIGTDGTLFGCQEEATKEDTPWKIGHLSTGIDEDLHLNLINSVGNGVPLTSETEDCSQCYCKDWCAASYCTVSNYQTTGDANKMSKFDCRWKQILNNTALRILEQAKLENSELFLEYLKRI